MKLHKIETPAFKIDGGAYFGVVPKIIWEKKYPADEKNMCNASCRSLLAIDGERVILFDTGIGEDEGDNRHASYFVDYSENLIKNLNKLGYSPTDITDVVLTHLHFDHCGGTAYLNKKTNKSELVFPNATHYISQSQWDTAIDPNYREKSSYYKDKFEFLKDSDKLVLIQENTNLTNNVELRLFNGHTAGLMLPVIKCGKETLFYTGDLIPAMASIPLAWISAYDLFPLTAIDEKREILEEAVANDWKFMFQHDNFNECCDLKKTERGVRAFNTYKFDDIF